MAGSSFGTIFKLSSFGESHGVALGGVIDGCPPGIIIDLQKVQNDLNRRKPGQSSFVQKEKKRMRLFFYQVYLKEKLQGLQ